MKTKKTVFASVFVAGAAFAMAASTLGTKALFSKAATPQSSWSWTHYAAVAPTFESAGCKEYWISCDDADHAIYLTAPETGSVTENKTPTAEFIAGLASDDIRYVAKYSKAISFEDGLIPSVMSISSNGDASVITDEHTDGSKGLAIELNGSTTVSFDRTYLNALFALDGVEALLFDVKAEDLPDYSKPTLMYYRSATNQYGVGKYEVNANTAVSTRGDNVRNYWKTFMFTSAMLADLNADNGVMRFDNMNGNVVYIDNIRVGKNPANNANVIDFNAHSMHKNSDNVWEVLSLYKNYEGDGWSPVFGLYSNSAISAEFSNEYASEGPTSLHVVSSGLVRFGILPAVSEAMGANDYVQFDYFVDPTNGNDQHVYGVTWGNYLGSPANYSNKGKWVTFRAAKGKIGYTSDLGSYHTFATVSGATNIYIDNVKVVHVDEVETIGFEDGAVTTFDSSYYGYSSKYNGMYASDNYNLHLRNGTDIYYQGSFNVSVSDERSTEGARSLKAVATAANSGLYISQSLYNRLSDAGITFDIYVTADVNFNTLGTDKTGLHHWSHGNWITLTVTKDMMYALGNGYLLFTYAGVTTSYIDNVRAAVEEPSARPDLVETSTYDWYE